MGRSKARTPPREELITQHVAGRSFLDVGCMWSVDGALCFAAEDAGATAVTVDPARGYVSWWWGLTPSAVLAMVETAGFDIRDTHRTNWHLTVVGTPR